MRLAFSRGLRQLIEQDAEVQSILYQVGQLVLPPSALQRPDIADRVVKLMRAAA